MQWLVAQTNLCSACAWCVLTSGCGCCPWMSSHQLTTLFLVIVTPGVSGDTANSAPENWTGFCFTSSRFRLRGISLLAKQTKDAFVHSSLDLLVWLARSFKWTRSCFEVLIYHAVSVVRMAERSKAPDSRFNSFYRFLQTESVLVHVCGRGFESHFWHRLFLLFYCMVRASKTDHFGCAQ